MIVQQGGHRKGRRLVRRPSFFLSPTPSTSLGPVGIENNFSRHASARDQRWKLYEDGRLFDIANDVLQQHPLRTEQDPPAIVSIRKRLRAVLASQSQGAQ